MQISCPFCEQAVSTEDEFIETIKCEHCHKIVDAASIIDRYGPEETISQGQATDFDEPGAGDLIGRFRIVEKIGQGGFGAVFKAHDLELDRDVAIKLPRIDRMSLMHAEEFLREAQTAAKLRDPNIVSVYEIGRFRQFLYIVSDFVSGPSLSELIEQVELTDREAAKLFEKLARGLHQAHLAGVVHRDMKPGNVLMDPEAGPMITDFGLARRLDEDIDSRVNSVMGTPSYMSPEQAHAKSDSADGRADIFSVGVMLYQVLTGKLPFRGKNAMAVIEQVKVHQPEDPREIKKSIPRPLEAICLKALQKDPQQRFQTAEELAEDLQRFSAGMPTKTLPENLLQTSSRMTRRHWKPAALGVAFVLVAIGSIAAWLAYQQWLDSKQRVIIQTKPADAQFAVISINANGRIDRNVTIRVSPTDKHFLKLPPGQYFFEVWHPQSGLQEAWRTVPENETSVKLDESNNLIRNKDHFVEFSESEQSEIDNATNQSKMAAQILERSNKSRRVVLPSIEIKQFNPRDHDMVFVEGGEFMSGSDVMASYPLEKANVHSFHIQRREVTVGEFRKVMGQIPPSMSRRFPNRKVPDNIPVTNVRYAQALEYTERIGMRLPTLEEYLFVATNGGTTKYPWGNDVEVITEWKADLIAPPEFDVTTMNGVRIQGLYSRCLEWTQTFGRHPQDSQGSGVTILESAKKFGSIIEDTHQWRFVVGGGNWALNGDEHRAEFQLGPRGFHLLEIEATQMPGLGFRCARSAQPRWVKIDQK